MPSAADRLPCACTFAEEKLASGSKAHAKKLAQMIHAMKQQSNDAPHESALPAPPGIMLCLWSCEPLLVILSD